MLASRNRKVKEGHERGETVAFRTAICARSHNQSLAKLMTRIKQQHQPD